MKASTTGNRCGLRSRISCSDRDAVAGALRRRCRGNVDQAIVFSEIGRLALDPIPVVLASEPISHVGAIRLQQSRTTTHE